MPVSLRPVRRRLLLLLALHLAALAAALLCMWLLPLLPAIPTCFMQRALHLYCPGCGGTRAVSALLRGQFAESFLCNPTVTALAVLVLFFDVCAVLSLFPRFASLYRTRAYRLTRNLLLAVLPVTAIVQFVCRNLLLVTGRADYLGDLISFWR